MLVALEHTGHGHPQAHAEAAGQGAAQEPAGEPYKKVRQEINHAFALAYL